MWSTSPLYNISNCDEFATPKQEYIPDELLYPTFAWDGDSTQIRQIVNQGAFLGIYYGHGSCNGWEHMDKIQADMFESCEKRPLIFSISCSTGDPNWSMSFANRLSRAQYGPIATFASIDKSYVIPNQYLLYGLTNCIFPNYAPTGRISYFSKFTESYKLGDILNRACAFCNTYIGNFYKIHNFLTYTCFGDPSIDLYTEVPTNFNEPLITNFGPLVYVNLNIENESSPIYINFYEPATGRVESYEYQGANYYYEASSEVSEVKVSITSHNKIPYICNVGVNDGESAYPRPTGKFTNASLTEDGNTLNVEFELSHSLDDYTIRYITINDNLQGYETDIIVNLDRDAESLQIPLSSGFNGYVQLYMIYNNYLLDDYRVKVNLNN